MSSNGTKEKAVEKILQFDFSHLFTTESVNVLHPDDSVAFSVVVGQLTHGEKSDAQARMMSSMEIPLTKNKARRESEIQQSMKAALKSGVIGDVSEYETLTSIRSWTLTTANGEVAPICMEAWRGIPQFYAAQIEKVVERLNPDLDDDFQDEPDSEG